MVVRLFAQGKKGKGKGKTFKGWPRVVKMAQLKEVLDKVPPGLVIPEAVKTKKTLAR